MEDCAASLGEHVLPKETFRVSRTIGISDNCHIAGYGKMETTLVLADGTDNDMFTNSAYRKNGTNQNIRVSNLRLKGNQHKQAKPEDEKRLGFCNAFYMANVRNCSFEDLVVENVFQTALHFRRCMKVRINRFESQDLGWSGISTSGTNGLEATKFYIYNSGNDDRHSAVHLDVERTRFCKGKSKNASGTA